MRRLFTIDAKYHSYGQALFSWHPDCQFLATAGLGGDSHSVYIWDRYGTVVEEISLGPVAYARGLEWDKDGDVLAVLATDTNLVFLWDRTTRKSSTLDTNMKDLTFLKWSKTQPTLAVGTGKGNLLIFNRKTTKKIPILGKHTKKISCGAWNLENKLALGSDDKMISISNAEGDTIDSTSVKYEPVDLQFSEMKLEERAKSREHTVSINMGRKTILLYNLNDRDNPVELAFQPRYGGIVSYRWFGDGYIMIGFSSGFLVIISTHMKEIGEELFSQKFHENLTDVSLSPPIIGSGGASLQRAATAGDNVVRILDLADYKEVQSETIALEGSQRTDKIEWSRDGQILSVSSMNGHVHAYMARVPVLNASFDTRVAYLTSLRELSIVDVVSEHDIPITVIVTVEPTIVALGPGHVSAGLNNHVWFYRSERSATKEAINQREYLGTVDDVKLNRTHAAVLSEGKIQLHPIENLQPGEGEEHEAESRMFPDGDKEHDIKCMALTNDFLIYGTDRGTINYFYLSDWVSVNEFRHDHPVLKVYPNANGTRILFIDSTQAAFLYNPVNDQKIPVPKFPANNQGVLWDLADNFVFISVEQKDFVTYVYSPVTIGGPLIQPIGTTKRVMGQSPILSFNGNVTCQMQNGQLSTSVLTTHDCLGPASRTGSVEAKKTCFAQDMALKRLKDAWALAIDLDHKDVWIALAQAALTQLDIDLAIRVYRQIGDAAMVMALQKIQPLEDKNLLAGHVALLFGDYSQAQELFLSSSRPITALEMRRDLLHWEQALKLATTLAPQEIPLISREYAQQLEFRGEYNLALQMYERGVTRDKANTEHNVLCTGGIARMNIRLGNVPAGVKIAMESGNKQLCKDCAQILEGMKQMQEAAQLYEKGENFEKAASIYIATKNFQAAAPLMAKITVPKLHSQYAKAKEVEGAFSEAAAAYERAKDMDNVVRLNLDQLKNPQKAFAIVRKTRSADGAALVAHFCQTTGDFKGAIEFLLIAKRSEEAFDLAQAHDEMDTYATALGTVGTPEEYQKIAQYYESKGNFAQAGKFYSTCGQFHKALKLFLQCGEKEIDRAIEVVGKAKSDMLTHTLIDFLMGDTDGVPKDPNFIFRLYMALGNFPQAAKTAIIIARQEQELGNYKVAHTILFDTYKDLEAQHIKVPQELARNLLLLHSYILVKVLVKQGDHLAGARMLIRVAKNISKFPSHIVPILTSTVIECQRSGLKRSSFEYASMLMRPEYRSQIAQAYKRKIESIVRKPDRAEEEEDNSPCPHCRFPLPNSQLECPSCKNTIPYCIATGRHMVLEDWGQCPSCRFPTLHTAFVTLIQTEKSCPMCNQEIVPSAIVKVENPQQALQKIVQNVHDEETPKEGEQAEAS